VILALIWTALPIAECSVSRLSVDSIDSLRRTEPGEEFLDFAEKRSHSEKRLRKTSLPTITLLMEGGVHLGNLLAGTACAFSADWLTRDVHPARHWKTWKKRELGVRGCTFPG